MKRNLLTLLVCFLCFQIGAQNVIHRVSPGETLASISQEYGITVEELVAANPSAQEMTVCGMDLSIPKAGSKGDQAAGEGQTAVADSTETKSGVKGFAKKLLNKTKTGAKKLKEKAKDLTGKAKDGIKKLTKKGDDKSDTESDSVQALAETAAASTEVKEVASTTEAEKSAVVAETKTTASKTSAKKTSKKSNSAESTAKTTTAESTAKTTTAESTAKTTAKKTGVKTYSQALSERVKVSKERRKNKDKDKDTITSIVAASNTGDFFEGELVYMSFENNNKKTIRLSSGFAYNGIRRIRIFVKGNKMHMVDESMHIHTILDPDNNIAYFYSDVTKKGLKLDCKKYVETYLCGNDVDVMNRKDENGVMPLESTFKNTGEKVKYMDYECDVYAGKKTSGEMIDMSITLWAVEDFKICDAIRYMASGLHFNGLPTKYMWDGYTKVPLIGTLTSYVCSELKSVTPKLLTDADFLPPTDFEINEYKTALKLAMKVLGVYKESCKYLKKNGMYPPDAEQESEATYKIEDEWDF